MRPRHPRLTASIAACVGALALAGCTSELSSDLDEAQADEIVLALDESGIGAEKERSSTDGHFRVIVTREDLAPALAVLREHDLPREEPPGLDSLFAERGLVPSAVEEHARQTAATAGELARSIESLDGVARARVHLAIPEPAGHLLDEAPARASASVLIELRPHARVDERAIRGLVAGAVTGLSAEDVAVVRTEARPSRRRERHLVTIGPITVTRGSAGALKALLAGSFALNLVLAALVVVVRRRRDAARRPPDSSGAPESSTG